MTTLAGRTYEVKRSEFPLQITIAAKNASGHAGTTVIVGHIREVQNGVEVDERDATIHRTETVITYRIDPPKTTGQLDIVQSLLGFFAKTEPDDARFDIVIQPSTGQAVSVSIRRPTFNPAIAALKFQVK